VRSLSIAAFLPSPFSFSLSNAMSANVALFHGNSLCQLIPASAWKKNNHNVIKCNHFLAQRPTFTLNTARRSLLRPAPQRTNVIQIQPKNPPATPENAPPRANVIKSDIGQCRDACRKQRGTTPAPALRDTQNSFNVGECGGLYGNTCRRCLTSSLLRSRFRRCLGLSGREHLFQALS